jgi:hypothetical protein
MFGNRPWLVIVILAFVLPAFAAPAADEKAIKETAAQKVRLKLLAIEIAQLTSHYEGLVKRELELQEAIRACTKSGDNRLHEYEEARKQAYEDLEVTTERLNRLEVEKTKLTEASPRKTSEEAALDSTDKLSRTLEAILQRLDKIEKRLEKMEAQRK